MTQDRSDGEFGTLGALCLASFFSLAKLCSVGLILLYKKVHDDNKKGLEISS